MVHEACAAYARGIWMYVPEEWEGYFVSFKAWFDKYVVKVVAVEQEVCHDRWGYIGHADLIALVAGLTPKHTIAIIDYKTPVTINRRWMVQIAAYVEAAKKQYGVEIGGALQLRKDGGLPKMTWVEDHNRAFAAFTGILSGWNYIKGGG